MATSGYKDEYVTKYNTLRFNWSRSSYSIENNSSTISWNLQLISSAYGAISSSASKAWSVNVNGSTYSGSNTVGINNNTTKTLASGTTDVYHNADGSKSFAYSFSQQFDINFSGYVGTVSGSSSGTLDPIPRYSELTSATDFTDETNPTIEFTNPSNGYFALRAKIEAGGNNKLIIRDIESTSTSYTFSLTEAERKTLRQLATSNTLSVILTICCMSGETELSSSYAFKTMTIVDATPTLSPTVIDEGSYSTVLTGDPNKIIRYYNSVKVAFNASAKKEATISSMKVTCGSKSRTSDGSLSYVDSGTFVFTVIDGRGNTATETVTKDMIDYIPLTCNLSTNSDLIDGSTVNLNLTVAGRYFSGSFGAVTNSLSVEYRYKTNDGDYPTDDGNEVWTPLLEPVLTDGNYTAQTTIAGLNYNNTYIFQARAKDVINDGWVSTLEQTVRITPVFDWGKNDFNFNVPVTGKEGFISSLSSSNSYASDTDSDETALNAWLDEQLSSMPNDSRKDVCVCSYPAIHGYTYTATLYRHTSDYAVLNGVSYNYDRLHKIKFNGAWKPAYCGQTILWSGADYMHADQVAYLSENVSAQPNGIVLWFSEFDPATNKALSSCNSHHFVPKSAITNIGEGNGHQFSIIGPWSHGCKYIYIYDDRLVGASLNSQVFTVDGITFKNNKYVLRMVYGV